MGRAPNSGAPQRVSAHVVAKPVATVDEEEKTTVESGWEEEASTTVEQGDVAAKLLALNIPAQPVTPPPRANNTSITGTGSGAIDEPTVDDQHANGLVTPSVAPARLVVTTGNDNGQ